MVNKMIKFGKGVVKLRIPILILAFLLLIPSGIGYINTRVNYDILSYLPGEIETMKGQDILLDEFGTGAFSLVVVEGMDDKDLQKVADEIGDINHVKKVIWYGSVVDFSIPREALPDDIYDFFNNKDADSQLMAVLFDESMSSDGTMDAIEEINGLVGDQCFVSGLPVKYRTCNRIQPRFECLHGADFLHYQSTCSSPAARCNNGLLNFPVAQLSGESGTIRGRQETCDGTCNLQHDQFRSRKFHHNRSRIYRIVLHELYTW